MIKSIQNVVQTNVSVCTSLGQPFTTQFNVIFPDMLQVRTSSLGKWGGGTRSEGGTEGNAPAGGCGERRGRRRA